MADLSILLTCANIGWLYQVASVTVIALQQMCMRMVGSNLFHNASTLITISRGEAIQL